MSYWRLYYHIIWGTKNRAEMIDVDRSRLLERSIIATAAEFESLVHAIGIMPDHVHVAISIPPAVPLAEVVKRLKGTSSRRSNLMPHSDKGEFKWQPEYGILSIGERSLDDVVDHVRNQRVIHETRKLRPTFETFGNPGALITLN